MTELKDARFHRDPTMGNWVVNLCWKDEYDVWHRHTKEFESQRRAMGFCELYGWRLPLSMWQSAVEAEPAKDAADNMVLEPA